MDSATAHVDSYEKVAKLNGVHQTREESERASGTHDSAPGSLRQVKVAGLSAKTFCTGDSA